jgi:hypothetical protein
MVLEFFPVVAYCAQYITLNPLRTSIEELMPDSISPHEIDSPEKSAFILKKAFETQSN